MAGEPAPQPGGTRAASWLLAGLGVAAIGGALAAASYRAFDLDRFFVPKELALHAGALVAAVTLVARRGERHWFRADVALAAWVLLSLWSAVYSTSGQHAFRALGITLSGAAVFWAASMLRDAGRSRAVVLLVAAAATIASASSLAQAYGLTLDVFALNRAPGGTLGNRNFIAHVAAMSLPLLIWLAATAKTSFRALLGSGATLVAAAALVLSRTRAAWLALAVWLILAIPLVWRSRGVIRTALAPHRAKLLGGALISGVALALVLPNTLDWRSDSPYLDSVKGVVNFREGSGAGRLKQYQNSLKMARAHPLVGVGPGNWAAEYPAFAARNDPSLSDATGMAQNPWPSSDWVAAVSERGAIATAALAAFVLILLTNAWRGWSDSVFSSRERMGALAGGSVVLIGAVEGVFDAVTLLAFPTVILWAAAGALIPAGRAVKVFSAPDARARFYLAAIVALIWTGFVARSAFKIDAMRLFTQGSYDSVRAAAARDPGSYRIQLRAAEIQAARGYCRLAYHNAMRANGLFPHAVAAQKLVAQCANSQR